MFVSNLFDNRMMKDFDGEIEWRAQNVMFLSLFLWLLLKKNKVSQKNSIAVKLPV